MRVFRPGNVIAIELHRDAEFAVRQFFDAHDVTGAEPFGRWFASDRFRHVESELNWALPASTGNR